MAGMEARLEPVEGIPNAGLLLVKGPNVMLGYIRPDAPGRIVPPEDGWYDTGDVASIDEEGFIAIRGRMKRFAKIGGETVSLAVVENIAAALWPDNHHAAVAVPDERKGEQIVLVTDAPRARAASTWWPGRRITASPNWRCRAASWLSKPCRSWAPARPTMCRCKNWRDAESP